MKEKNVKAIIEELSEVISLSYLAKKYFCKDKSWLYHKLHEHVINGVKYKFSDAEVLTLVDALGDMSQIIASTQKKLKKLRHDSERSKGRYLTVVNPFNHPLFHEWFAMIPQSTILLEPFAGNCNIVAMLRQLQIHNEWACYDIEPIPCSDKVVKRDTLRLFPKGYKVCVTNPPFLARNSAKKRVLPYPSTKYDNIYKYALHLMLSNCEYIAAILPESFISSGLFRERLYGVISITQKLFMNTDYPVCLALFVPGDTADFYLYIGENYLGSYSRLITGSLVDYMEGSVQWKMNVPNGNIGVICFDGTNGEGIKFIEGNCINSDAIKYTSRSMSRIEGLPSYIDLSAFIEKCNEVLFNYRKDTHDIFLTSFKGLRKDGRYRRRIDFKTVKCILNKAISLMS